MNKGILITALTVAAGHAFFCAPVHAVPYDTNLLLNPNAEEGPATSNGELVSSVPGWTTTGTFTVVTYDSPDGATGFPKTSDPGPPNRGLKFFAGGINAPISGTSTVTATKKSMFQANAADINNNTVGYELSGYLGGFGAQPDDARVTLTFFNGAIEVGTGTMGPVTPADRDPDGAGSKPAVTALSFRTRSGQVPVGTNRIRVELIMTKASGNGSSNDGYADNLSLMLIPSVVPLYGDDGRRQRRG